MPRVRLAERVRQPARPRGRVLPLRAVRHQPSDRARLRAGHERARHDLEDAGRLDRRARRADDGPARARRTRSRRTRGRRPTTTPTTCSSARSSASTDRVEVELVCEPVFDYGREPAEWTLVDGGSHAADATGAGQTIRLQSDLALGIEGEPRAGAARARAGRPGLLRPLVGRGLAAPEDVDDADARIAATVALLARLAGPRADPRPPLARPDPALGARDQGPHVHADRRDGGRAHDVAAGDAGRRAQLGLPLHLDARHDVHAAGAPLPEPRLGGRRVHAVRRRHRGERGRLAADHVRDRRPPRPDGVDARRPLRLRGARPVRIGNGAFDQRQNDVFGAVLDSILLHTRRSKRLPRRLWPIVQAQAECATSVWQKPDQGIWEARGAPQHYVSSKLMCWVALDRAAKLAEIRGDPELQATWQRDRRGDPRGHPRARRQRPRRPAPALRDRRARRLDAAGGDLRLPAGATTSACGTPCSRSRTS